MMNVHILTSKETFHKHHRCQIHTKKIGTKMTDNEWQLALLMVKGRGYSLVSLQDGRQLWIKVRKIAETKHRIEM